MVHGRDHKENKLTSFSLYLLLLVVRICNPPTIC
jgi:hypothetical protein